MKFFIDTANLSDIKEAYSLGILDGVTTNPSLMAKEGIAGYDAVMKHYLTICEIVDGPVSAEVIATDFEGMVREGEALAALHSNIVVKIPMIPEGIKAIKYFSEKGIKADRMTSKGYGSSFMLYPKAVTEAEQIKNRRVEIVITKE